MINKIENKSKVDNIEFSIIEIQQFLNLRKKAISFSTKQDYSKFYFVFKKITLFSGDGLGKALDKDKDFLDNLSNFILPIDVNCFGSIKNSNNKIVLFDTLIDYIHNICDNSFIYYDAAKLPVYFIASNSELTNENINVVLANYNDKPFSCSNNFIINEMFTFNTLTSLLDIDFPVIEIKKNQNESKVFNKINVSNVIYNAEAKCSFDESQINPEITIIIANSNLNHGVFYTVDGLREYLKELGYMDLFFKNKNCSISFKTINKEDFDNNIYEPYILDFLSKVHEERTTCDNN
jgi:hypothetical protein